MMKIFISFLMIIISLLMMFLNHPLSMGLMILTQTLLICLISGLMIKTYWFSYILFLTFLGGLLVLFIYVSSVASNELFSSFNLNMKMFFLSSLLILFILQLSFYNNMIWLNLNSNFMDSDNFFNNFFFNNENKININKLYNNHSFMMMTMMIIYLFISLIAIVKITNIYFGPLRTI